MRAQGETATHFSLPAAVFIKATNSHTHAIFAHFVPGKAKIASIGVLLLIYGSRGPPKVVHVVTSDDAASSLGSPPGDVDVLWLGKFLHPPAPP